MYLDALSSHTRAAGGRSISRYSITRFIYIYSYFGTVAPSGLLSFWGHGVCRPRAVVPYGPIIIGESNSVVWSGPRVLIFVRPSDLGR